MGVDDAFLGGNLSDTLDVHKFEKQISSFSFFAFFFFFYFQPLRRFFETYFVANF